MKNLLNYVSILLALTSLSGCGYGTTSKSYDQNSLQARIMNNLISSGEERACRDQNGKRAIYNAKDFMMDGQKVTAHVVTFLESNEMFLHDAKYENGTFWNMKPHINFEVFENGTKNPSVIYISDDLTNNPIKLEDFVGRIKQSHNKFIFPAGMNKNDVELLNESGMYNKLLQAYKIQFLSK